MKLRYIIPLFFIILITACNDDEDDKKKDTQSDIIFNVGILESATQTSYTPINAGVKATFYAFKAGTDIPVAEGNYYASTSGQMTGLNNYIMYLLPGNYDFYGISQNNTDLFLPLNNLESSNLKNGVDYLWTNITNKSITGASTLLSVTFQHIASKLTFELESGNNVKLNTIDSILIQTPVEDVKLNLLKSSLSQTTSLNAAFTPMSISGLNSDYYLLPVNPTTPLKSHFFLKINNQTNESLYALDIVLPSGGFQSGKSYNYKLSISETEIIIKAYTVSDWIVNDNTGNPIYPED